MPVPSGMQWTREYLRQKGIPDSEITWNPQTSSVSVYGQQLKPEYGEAGKSYASTANLDKFFASLQPTFRMNQLMGQIDQLRNFQYNPQTDPAFQQAQKGISRSVMNTMQDRGLLLSTQTPERIAQATAEALPQFESAAYQRNQQNLQNLFNLVQTLQQQKQAEEETKRQQTMDALSQLGVISGLTGRIPGGYEQYGLKAGDLTAEERARRDAAARANQPARVSLRDQLREGILNGTVDATKLTPYQIQVLGLNTPKTADDTAAIRSELRQLISLKTNSGYSDLSESDQKWVDSRIAQLQSTLAGGSAPVSQTDPYTQRLQDAINNGEVTSYDEVAQMVDELRDQIIANGGNPDAILEMARQHFGR